MGFKWSFLKSISYNTMPCDVAVLTLDVHNNVCVLLCMARPVTCFHLMLTAVLGLWFWPYCSSKYWPYTEELQKNLWNKQLFAQNHFLKITDLVGSLKRRKISNEKSSLWWKCNEQALTLVLGGGLGGGGWEDWGWKTLKYRFIYETHRIFHDSLYCPT